MTSLMLSARFAAAVTMLAVFKPTGCEIVR
jgi:hypothetical protein